MRHSFWRLILAGIFLLQGLWASPMLSAAPVAPSATPLATQSLPLPHAAACRCQHCLGARACCCRPTANPFEAACLTAACDHPLTALVAVKVAFPLITPPVGLLLFAAQPSLPRTQSQVVSASLAITPPAPPPRFSFEIVHALKSQSNIAKETHHETKRLHAD